MAVVMMMVVIFTSCGFTADAASGKIITWKTKKIKSGYVTKFYDNGKLDCSVCTNKKLKVRMYREEELTESDLTGRYNKYIIVEVIDGTCINNKGDGITDTGYYISYKRLKSHKKGRKYTTYCIYDNSRYIDDVIGRFDKRRK